MKHIMYTDNNAGSDPRQQRSYVPSSKLSTMIGINEQIVKIRCALDRRDRIPEHKMPPSWARPCGTNVSGSVVKVILPKLPVPSIIL